MYYSRLWFFSLTTGESPVGLIGTVSRGVFGDILIVCGRSLNVGVGCSVRLLYSKCTCSNTSQKPLQAFFFPTVW